MDYPDLVKKVLLWTSKGGDRTPREVLAEAGLWQAGADKPLDPKKAVEYLYEHGYSRDMLNGIFKRLALALPSVRGARMSRSGCWWPRLRSGFRLRRGEL